ncbi:DUF5954 family protein [Kitasatospora sp. NPDC050463]|uniref:DUF5954 family protein n=1 Tax=Kitasatospora sp. NPDC050463 TaxID=3155786 RepID=UPI00340497A8
MDDDAVRLPEHRAIRVAHSDDPVAAVAGLGAWASRQRYPSLMTMPPAFGGLQRTDDGAWRILGCHATTPQTARDDLGHGFRCWGRADPSTRSAAAADRLDAERGHELRAADRRFRLVWVEPVVRLGPDGPELPRTSDWDPDLPVKVRERRDRAAGRYVEDDEEG